MGALFKNSTSPTGTRSLESYKLGSAIMTLRPTVLLCSWFCQSTTRGEGVFLWLKWLTDGKIKNRRLPTLHCDTMATVQSCPDCAGFANETVPFLALFFFNGDKFLENAPSFLGFRRASYRGTVCGHSEIFFREGALRPSSPWRPHRFN